MRATRTRTPARPMSGSTSGRFTGGFTRRPTRWLLALSAGLLGAHLTGCDHAPVDATAMSHEAALRVQDIIHNMAAGVGFAAQDGSAANQIASGIGTASDGVKGAMQALMPAPMMMAMGGDPLMRAMAPTPAPSMMTTEEKLDDAADTLKTWLDERILTDTNLETRDSDGAVYLLHPDPTCRPLPADGDPAGTLPDVNADCADKLTKLPIRIELHPDGDGARFRILIGPDRLELSTFTVHSDLLAIEIDLDQAKRATDYINATLGDGSPMSGSQVTRLVGRVRYSLHKDCDKKVTFAVSVLAPIDVAVADASGAPNGEIKVGVSDPAFSLTGDGVARTLTIGVNLARTDVITTWDPNGSGVKNSDYHVALGGLTGQSTLTEDQKDLTVKGLGIGETFLEVRGTKIFDLNLNPDDMRRFDLHATVNADGLPRFEVTPRFDLSLGYHFSAVASDFVSAPPSYFLDETYGVRLVNGSAPAAIQAVASNSAAGFAGGIKVEAGTLTISSSSVPDAVTVPTGKCLTGNPSPPAGAHPILGALSVTDCP